MWINKKLVSSLFYSVRLNFTLSLSQEIRMKITMKKRDKNQNVKVVSITVLKDTKEF